MKLFASIFLIAVFNLSTAQTDISRGLVANYPFNGNAKDMSSIPTHGEVFGARLVNDRFENSQSAYFFDGIDDYIIFKRKHYAENNNLSVSFWIKPIKEHNSLYFAMCSDFGLSQWSKRIGLAISIPRTNGSGVEIPEFEEWYHVVGTYDGSYVKAYLNGNFFSKFLHKGNISDPDRVLMLGNFITPLGNNFWSGYLDDLRIYNRVITGDEIQLLYNQNNTTVDIDINIPCLNKKNNNAYALIIGNEDYSSFQQNLSNEVNVNFAINDAKMFKEYSINILGIPEENITYIENATAVKMHRAIDKLNALSKHLQDSGELTFYYAGHGFPDEITKKPYLIPVDVSGADLKFALSLDEVFKKLTQYPTKRTTVFLDACFSGGARNQGLLSTRGVKIVPKTNDLKGNIIVFSSSSANQSSLSYDNKKHGLFTYYLLKKLNESKGDLSYGELSDYLIKQVSLKSIMIFNKEQVPNTNISTSLQNEWRGWSFKVD